MGAAGASLKALQTGTNTLSGVISGTGSVNQLGTGKTILQGAEIYTGLTNITAGTLENDGSLAAGSTVAISANGTLSGGGTVKGKVTLTGNGAIDLGSGAIISGTLTATGGSWSGSGTVGGLVTSSSGTFSITGILTAPAGLAVTGGTIGGTGTLTGSLTDTSSTSMTFGGAIAGPASAVTMNKASSTLTLTGMNTYGGVTTITAGSLQVGDGTTGGATLGVGAASIGASGTLTTDLASGETLGNGITDNGQMVAAGATNNYTISSLISGTGKLSKTGVNAVKVTNANTYKGGTTISAGTLLVNNTSGSGTGTGAVTINSGGVLGGSGTIGGAVTLNSGGTLFPGAGLPGTAGTTLHAASLMWNNGGTLNLQLGPTGDELVLTGALTKGSAGSYFVDITDAGGLSQTSYTLATFASTTFSASSFTLAMPTGYSGHLVETSTSLILDVDSGSGEQPAHSESVAHAEFFAAEDSISADSSSLTVTPTPEPGSVLLLAFGGATLLGWRRRRSRS